MNASIHSVEHVQIQFDKLNVEHREKTIQTIKITITDEDGYEHNIDLFMNDSGTLNINQR